MRTCTIYADLHEEPGRFCEWQCQVMLEAGLKFLAGRTDYDLEREHVELNEALRTARFQAGDRNSISGAQQEAVITHLTVIRAKGRDYWLRELAKARPPEEVFEFDGTFDSVPKTRKT